MPKDYTRAVVDVDAETSSGTRIAEADPVSEQILYVTRPGQWAGIEVMRSRHVLKRVRVNLKNIPSSRTSPTARFGRRGTRNTSGGEPSAPTASTKT